MNSVYPSRRSLILITVTHHLGVRSLGPKGSMVTSRWDHLSACLLVDVAGLDSSLHRRHCRNPEPCQSGMTSFPAQPATGCLKQLHVMCHAGSVDSLRWRQSDFERAVEGILAAAAAADEAGHCPALRLEAWDVTIALQGGKDNVEDPQPEEEEGRWNFILSRPSKFTSDVFMPS